VLEIDAFCRSLGRIALTVDVLSIDESGTESVVCYLETEGAGSDEEIMRTFSPLEFLIELSLHVPRVFEQTTRWFGVDSPRARGAERRKKRFQELMKNNFAFLDPALPERRPSQSWVRLMKLVFELDPLRCPKC